MNYMSVGDMAQAYQLRRHNAQLKTTMTRLSEELTTGVQKDVGAAVKGDFRALAAIERSLSRLASFDQTATEAGLFADTQQSALQLIQSQSESMGATLVAAATTSSDEMVRSVTGDAAQRFDSIVGVLNINVAGRYVFSGTATDTAPLAASEDILSALSSAISGLTTAEDISTAVDSWFDAPAGSGGYADLAYQGSSTATAPMQVSETERVDLGTTAMDDGIRGTLKGFAVAALVGRNMVPGDLELRSELTRMAGEQIATADAALTATSARVGTAQEAISSAQARNSTETSALELSRTGMIGIDEYDSATALEAVQSQLETLYTLTARLSNLSLTDYMR